jgi:SAM-dependent methyltransferase
MPKVPDLTDPRYLDEIGWFLYHEKYGRDKFGGSYDSERLAYSRLLLDELVRYLGTDIGWMQGKTIISIGSGCTGDLAAFPAAVKIAIDPLLYAYQRLGMIIRDEVGSRTVYLSLGAEDLPLLDESADLVLCRNALDHMPQPDVALKEIWRILNPDGALFLSIDIGGEATPDEPTVFSPESLRDLLAEGFELATPMDKYPPHSLGRVYSIRFVARKKSAENRLPDKTEILRDYEASIAGKATKRPQNSLTHSKPV